MGLIVSTGAALAATCLAASSCRFMVVTYTSNGGNFDEYFSDSVTVTGDSPFLTYKTNLGLFQWLSPTDWLDPTSQEGNCVGYQTKTLESLSDMKFELGRGSAVFAVLLSFGVFIWTLFSAAFSFNWMQTTIMQLCCVGGALSSAMTFSLLYSPICKQTYFAESSCHVDDGGLIMCAAVIFWLVSSLIAVVFFKPLSEGKTTKRHVPTHERNLDPKEMSRRNEKIEELVEQHILKRTEENSIEDGESCLTGDSDSSKVCCIPSRDTVGDVCASDEMEVVYLGSSKP